MRLGVSLGYWGATGPSDQIALAVEADRLGYDVAWAAEAYGSDAATVLAWVGSRTERIGLGSAAFQMPARTPAMTAMTAATLDGLSGGRFRLGLGVSGPQVSEGWHGVPFADPIGRSREYVQIVRSALARQPVRHDGAHFTLPLTGDAGKPLRLSLGAGAVAAGRPPADIPIYLAAIGPANLELVGEVADGWLAIFLAPEHVQPSLDALRRGRARRDAESALEIAATVPVCVGDDPAACANEVRPYAALYLGGMGSRTHNFYNRQAVRMGFEDAARAVQDAYLDGRPRDAAALVPYDFLDQTSLLGPAERIRDRLAAYAGAGVTMLTVQPHGRDLQTRLQTLRVVADALEQAGLRA
jgi:F420-dependent oxidoreductase-like protein